MSNLRKQIIDLPLKSVLNGTELVEIQEAAGGIGSSKRTPLSAAITLILAGAVTSVNTRTGAVTLSKSDVGLSNVDNTSDANKPVSTAQAAADATVLSTAATFTVSQVAAEATARTSGDSATLASAHTYADGVVATEATARAAADALLAPKASPTLTGAPTAPTASHGDNTAKLATTAFVQDAVSSAGGGTVTSVSVTTANGVSGTVANPTTTPAISLTLGAITPTSVAASGAVTGSNLSGTNTGDQSSVTGNAGTATALQTARNIDGQAFNGSADITVIAPGTHAAASKATPVDADELPLVDSAAANVLKKLTWANLKATLKTYFDTLYAPVAFTPNVQNVASAATITPTFSNDMVRATAQAAALTIANPTGTAKDGWGIAFELKDDGTARGITFDTQYRGIGGALPTTTVAGKRMMFAAVFNNADTKWDIPLPVAQET